MPDLKVRLGEWELDNPVIPASGTFGYGHEFAQLYDINVLGTFSFKGTTRASPRNFPAWRAASIRRSSPTSADFPYRNTPRPAPGWTAWNR